ncbi:MAG: helix-turn-helix domain-containing protein [Gammaproteobacteria bacterium]|nr:MAG: helix-turn-helix domain-containing protein [Gammaproteobacteria bacterium]
MKQGLKQKQKLSLNLTANLGEQIKLLSLSGFEISSQLNDLIKDFFLEDEDKKVSYFQDELKVDQYKSVLSADNYSNIEKLQNDEIDLKENLLNQFELLPLNDIEFLIGQVLIDSIEENGRLDPELEFDDIKRIVYEDFNIIIQDQIIEKILDRIQNLDPPGCAFRNIRESLDVQIKHLDINKETKALLETNLDKIIENKINLKEIPQALKANLLKLSLNPGGSFGSHTEFYTRPDLVAIKTKDSWNVSLNDNFMSQDLIERIKNKVEKSKDKNKHEAKSFLKGLERRQQTLYLVAEVIVNIQSDFLNGSSKKKALSNKEIAELLNISPSTVSRIVRNKYIQLPNELTTLKSLLKKRVNKQNQSINITSEDLKLFIDEIVTSENKKSPLSDENIKKVLEEKLEINIARRTISKYRLELNIPSTRKRKSI